MSMERLKRKLTLLDVPVFEITDEAEIEPTVANFLHENDIRVGQESRNCGKESQEHTLSGRSGKVDPSLGVYTALIGVEESGIFFIESKLAEQVNSDQHQAYSVLLISERNVVESIEVALLRINSGSAFYGKQLAVIQPEALLEKSLVFILKSS